MIYLGADHAGFDLKKILLEFLDSKKIPSEDLGNLKLDVDDDYPDFAKRVAEKVAKEKNAKGILICGSGGGICVAANKIKGVRAVQIYNTYTARIAKRHDNANIICLAGRVLKPAEAKKLVKIWLDEKVSSVAKYKRRVNKIKKLEK